MPDMKIVPMPGMEQEFADAEKALRAAEHRVRLAKRAAARTQDELKAARERLARCCALVRL